jgi:hypothetical protein
MVADYTKIDEVINDFQLMIDDTSYDKEAHIYQLRLIALQGLRELKFDVEQEVNTATFVVDSTTLQVTLPDNYVKLLRVGFKGSDGNFHSLGSNPNLSLDAGVTSQINHNPSHDNDPNYRLDVGKKFGVGGGNNNLGYYRVNNSDNTINFSSGLAGKELFLEYLSDGAADDTQRVHKFCEEALRCYIYYKYVQRKRGIPANEKQMAKRAFFNEKRLARARMMNFSKETALQTSRKAFKQSPKF